MAFKILITRPRYDPPTTYLSYWGGNLIKIFKEYGIDYFDLPGPKANRKNLENFLKKHEPELVLLNGHGKKNLVAGQADEPLIVLGENEDKLANKIIYALSCETAVELAEGCIRAGALAYIGYKNKFAIARDKFKESVPHTDENAKPIEESSSILVTTLLKGKTVNEAYLRSQQKFQKCIEYQFTHYDKLYSRDILKCLLWNKVGQKPFGKLDAKLT